MELTAKNVHECMMRVLFDEGEVIDGKPVVAPVMVEGIVATFGFHPTRLNEEKSNIASMLAQLPIEFFPTDKGGGGGSSFLNACVTKEGYQWGEHPDMEALMVLGVGAGLIAYSLPREMWPVLAGGMPYFTVVGD